MKVFRCLERFALVFAACICACAITGCVESSFTLANGSRLPKSITLPPGVSRTEVSVTLNLYSPLLGGSDAKLVVKDRAGKTLAEVKGKTKEINRFMYYQIVTEKGITDTIKLKPYMEHENMEQNGRAVALFSVIDDPAVVKEESPQKK